MQLEFKVEQQIITRLDDNKVVGNSKDYLYAKFSFSEDWAGVEKTAVFRKADIYSKGKGTTYSVLLENDMCKVPHEVILDPMFLVSVFGGERITANRVEIAVLQSGYAEGETPAEPTPTVYEQILAKCEDAVETANDVKQRADNGEFKGQKGDKGEKGDKGDKGQKGDKGDKGDSYILTENDKEEIAGMTSASLKTVYTESFYTEFGVEIPPVFNSLITGVEMVAGSEYDEMQAEFYDADGNTLAVVKGEGKHEVDIRGAVSANFTDNYSAEGNFILKTYVSSALGKEVEAVAEKSTEESKAYTDKKIGSLLNGYALGNVIAIDDISPVSKDITVKMESKNLLPFPYYWNSRTVSGITFTVNDDGSVTANGTATATVNFMFVDRNTYTLPAGTYSFSLTPQVANSYYLVTGGSAGSPITSGNGNRTVTFGGGLIGYFALQIKQGVVLDNVTFYPQIEKGLKVSEYTPYFTEWDVAGLSVKGKNLFGGAFEIGGIAGASGGDYVNPAQIRSSYIQVGWDDYVLSNVNSSYKFSAMFFYDADKTLITMHTGTSVPNSKMTSKAMYVRFRLARADDANITEEDLEKVKSAFQFEVGTSATSYEPYVEPVCYEAWELAESGGKIEGMYPNTTLIPEVDGVVMGVEYSRDLNKAFGDLEQAIISLGGNI